MNQTMAQLFQAQGYAFVCSLCEKLHRAHEAGFTDGCEAAMNGQDCAGPISGKDYPLYEGPMSNDFLARLCYRCGADADVGVHPKGGRIIGSCKDHYEHVRPLSGRALKVKRLAGRR